MFWDRLIARKVSSFEHELMKKYYQEVETMYTKMRGWRHDYRHHIQTMKVHMSNGEYEETIRYLDMLDDDLTNVETIIRTGNRMTDAILNSKLSIAALDSIAENRIYMQHRSLTKEKTSIYISHRLTSTRFCDRIVVFDHGRIVQVGTHEELLSDTHGKYSELWNAQAQYYKG